MTTTVMREQLIAYLAQADDNKIKGLYSLLEENIAEHTSVDLTKEQVDFLDTERKLHMSGESRSYSWQEAKNMIRKAS